MTAIASIYPDLRRLIRIAAWLSWVPILAALAITNWGGSDLQGLAVYVWSAGITVQLFVGLSLFWLRRAKSRSVPKDPTIHVVGTSPLGLAEFAKSQDSTVAVRLDRESLDRLRALEDRFSSQEFRSALRHTFITCHSLARQSADVPSSEHYFSERVLRMAIAGILLKDDPIELGEHDREEVIDIVSNALHRSETAN